MTGQGSPKFVFSTFTATQLPVFVFIVALLFNGQQNRSWARLQQHYPLKSSSLANGPAPNQINRGSDRQLRLRLSWGGGALRTWTGTITVIDGAFSDVTPLGLGLDANAAAMQFHQTAGDCQAQAHTAVLAGHGAFYLVIIVKYIFQFIFGNANTGILNGNENPRSEERRVGKECRSRGSPSH